MFFSLQNKRALITGGGSGIGLATAKRFREAGASVIIADVCDGEATAAAIGAEFVSLDVSQSGAVNELFTKLADDHRWLDIVINNAGLAGDDGVAIVDSDDALTQRLFAVNTMGVYHGLKFAPKAMVDGGSIINTASLAASYVYPDSGPYSASKAAVVSFTTMAAAELVDRKIRVNAVAPSFIRTPMTEAELAVFEKFGEKATHAMRIAEPEEVAAVFHFLASDDASYINGQVICIDGGMGLGFTRAMADLINNA
jgi:NAD(P)-dependent dehydrogenase (short-subunit alcohol dehydrogenase family)